MKKIAILTTVMLTMLISTNANAWNWSKSVRGNGNVTKELRDVSSFSGVKASSGINVYLFQGDNEKVVVEADENIQECIITEVDGSVLNCYFDCNIRHSTKLNVYVNFKNLNKIKASSGSDIYGETLIETDELEIEVSSGADVKIEVEANEVDCDVSSGADATIKGKSNHFEGSASSGADIKAAGLKVKTCKASASSSGDIKIAVSEKIKASASSGGDVTYYGNPTVEHISESSGGDVKRK
ncbi:MAG: DUF2807 domain-containing protein [Prolixibacteraceae bacterium]|jgi:hypothetical protein|nr:DUF2807 domain-containing protein [Prolixibacteraceae bacterium]